MKSNVVCSDPSCHHINLYAWLLARLSGARRADTHGAVVVYE
jgi:hypothetical protein